MSIFGEARVDAITIDRQPFPEAEALRMMRAIACTAVLEAASDGCYNAAFRGFQIHAVRQALSCGVRIAICMIFNTSDRACVIRCVSGKPGHGGRRHPMGRDVIDQCDTIVVEPIDFTQVL